jgi:hypothetical protein
MPTASELLETLGGEVNTLEMGVLQLIPDTQADRRVQLILDQFGQSVSCQVEIFGEQVLEIYREPATNVARGSRNGSTWISIQFESENTTGQLEITLTPVLSVVERTLLR